MKNPEYILVIVWNLLELCLHELCLLILILHITFYCHFGPKKLKTSGKKSQYDYFAKQFMNDSNFHRTKCTVWLKKYSKFGEITLIELLRKLSENNNN